MSFERRELTSDERRELTRWADEETEQLADEAAARDNPPTVSEPEQGQETTGSGGPQVLRASQDVAANGESGVPELGIDELYDRWQRAVADMENLRKRYERQMEEVRLSERDRVTAEWLPVLDHLDLALQHALAEPQTIIAGVEAVRQQALGVLAQLGYERIVETGTFFDPARHEAAQVREDPEGQPGSVLEVLRSGYRSDRGLLRPAMVAVAGEEE